MKEISAFALLIRSSFYKILAILLLMTSLEGLVFYRLPGKGLDGISAERMIDTNFIQVIFLVTLGLVFFILSWTENKLDKNSGYTLLRMRITQKRFYVIKTIYNVFCLGLVFVLQIWLAIWMVRSYGEQQSGSALAKSQQLFLTFYRNEFLHCLLPLAEIGKWVRNILLLSAFSMQAAVSGKKNHIGDICLFVLAASWFSTDIGINILDMFCDLVFIVVIAVALLRVHGVFEEKD